MITGAVRGFSKEGLYEELGLEGRLCFFYKFYINQSPQISSKFLKDLKDCTPPENLETTKNAENIPFFKMKH